MPDLNTATLTRVEARERINRLHNGINALSAASWKRGASLDESAHDYAKVVVREDQARAVVFAELDILSELLLGLVEERTVSATAMRLLTESGEVA